MMLFIVQLVLLVVIMFGDIGFDRPGRFGMSFWHGVVLISLYVIALLAGLFCSIAEKNWRSALAQISVVLLVAVYLVWPAPSYDANDYQYLIGKSRADVESILSDRDTGTGMMGRGGENYEFTSYDGMTVIYDTDDIVFKVEANGE